MVIHERMTAEVAGDFVVFMIGMRVNRPWKIHRWLPLMRALPRMLRELKATPDTGLLSSEMWLGRTTIAVQYWRSLEQLRAYAANPEAEHLPAWRAFNRLLRTRGDVGIWHETYLVSAGSFENVYVNMPRFGLGKAGELNPSRDRRFQT
ncbi:DUF4188 domain-containing protein [Paraburkholderia bannensis]|uniref:DUF4188 domain-containing protein n=1 Tax=Paraburkholderia bannensis TaxID=765414 RepID=UPI000485AAA1|nr:DUF4188 domain-containing protein [Paraburkholderia bannensis]